ncbi:MAG: hypothetical protein M0R03_14910 [Novosphingobium sp.]|nr:hypothetical protein [Novosphingobium sp.]
MKTPTPQQINIILLIFLVIAALAGYYFGYTDGQTDTRLEFMKQIAGGI